MSTICVTGSYQPLKRQYICFDNYFLLIISLFVGRFFVHSLQLFYVPSANSLERIT